MLLQNWEGWLDVQPTRTSLSCETKSSKFRPARFARAEQLPLFSIILYPLTLWNIDIQTTTGAMINIKSRKQIEPTLTALILFNFFMFFKWINYFIKGCLLYRSRLFYRTSLSSSLRFFRNQFVLLSLAMLHNFLPWSQLFCKSGVRASYFSALSDKR